MPTVNYRKERYGTPLTNAQREHMVDGAKGSDFAKHLAPEGKKVVMMLQWRTDKEGNRMADIALESKAAGSKAFLTPKGGLGKKLITDAMIQAAIDNGISTGDMNRGAAIISAKPEPLREYPKGRSAVMVGYAFKPDSVSPMTNAMKSSIAKRQDLLNEAGKLDASKVGDAVKARYRAILNADAEVAKEAPAKETAEKVAAVEEQNVEKAAAVEEPKKVEKSETMVALESLESPHRLLVRSTPRTEAQIERDKGKSGKGIPKEFSSINVLDLDAEGDKWVNGLSFDEKVALVKAPMGVTIDDPSQEGATFTQISISKDGLRPTGTPKTNPENIIETWNNAKSESEIQRAIDAAKAEAEAEAEAAAVDGKSADDGLGVV